LFQKESESPWPAERLSADKDDFAPCSICESD